MKFNEKKQDFIQARAAGYSLRETAKRLGVSVGSCKKWEKALKEEVNEARATMEEDTARQYGLFRLARMEAIGATLQKIRLDVAARFHNEAQEIPLAKMLETQLKFETMARDLEMETRGTTPAMILAHLEAVKKGKAAAIDKDTLEKIRAAVNEKTPMEPEDTKPPFIDIERMREEAAKLMDGTSIF